MTRTLYGIKACDTMKKARVWLDENGVAYDFHDYKAAGADRADVERWVAEHGWEKVLNRAGTTFRKLSDADKEPLRKAIAKVREVAKGADTQAIKSAVSDLEQASHAFSKALYEKVKPEQAAGGGAAEA